MTENLSGFGRTGVFAARRILRKLIKDDCMRIEDLRPGKSDEEQALASERLGKAQAIYLAVTALATIGWFLLIGWCALQLV